MRRQTKRHYLTKPTNNRNKLYRSWSRREIYTFIKKTQTKTLRKTKVSIRLNSSYSVKWSLRVGIITHSSTIMRKNNPKPKLKKIHFTTVLTTVAQATLKRQNYKNFKIWESSCLEKVSLKEGKVNRSKDNNE